MATKLEPQLDVRNVFSIDFSELLPIAGVVVVIAYLLSAWMGQTFFA